MLQQHRDNTAVATMEQKEQTKDHDHGYDYDYERLAVILKDKMLPMLPLRQLVMGASQVCREWNHHASYLLQRRGFELVPPRDVILDAAYYHRQLDGSSTTAAISLFGQTSTGMMGFVGRGLRFLEENPDGWNLTTATSCIRIFDSSNKSSRAGDDEGRRKFNHDLTTILDTNGRRCFVTTAERRGVYRQTGHLWVAVDLGPRLSLRRPTAYALRHNSSQSRAVRNWTLQGSVSGAEGEWYTLDRRINDDALGTAPGSVAVFSISPETSGGVPERMQKLGFRFFRIVKTGPDAARDMWSFLHISGLEIYGHVLMVGGTALAGQTDAWLAQGWTI